MFTPTKILSQASNNMFLTSAGWVYQGQPMGIDYSANDIAYGEGLFVVVGDVGGANDFIETSADGISWTNRTAPMAGGFIQSVAHDGNTRFACVGSLNTDTNYATSDNGGITWVERAPGFSVSSNTPNISYAEGFWFIGIEEFLYRSATGDASSFSLVQTAPTSSYFLTEVAYSPVADKYVCSGGLTSTTPYAIYSTDGSSWTLATVISSGGYRFISVAYGNGKICLLGFSGASYRVWSSSDAITWSVEFTTAVGYSKIKFNRGQWCLVGTTGFNGTGTFATSLNLATWTEYNITSSFSGQDVAFSLDTAVFCGSHTGISNYITTINTQDI